MNSSMRPVLLVAVACVLALCLFGLHFSCSPVDLSEIRRRDDLRKLDRATLLRQELRRQAVHEWIAQRRTLTETMLRFQELDQEWPAYSPRLRKTMSESDEQRHYRVIRTYVEAVLQERPEQLAAALRRLEKDYRKLQADWPTPSTVPTERTERSR